MIKAAICITGANSQIGSFLAHRYHAAGYPLLLLYHQRYERISDLRDSTIQVPVDLMDSKAVEAALSVIEERIGCLIHTAAKRSSDALELVDSEPSVFRDVFDTNFYVAYNVLRAVLPQMRSNMFGRVILFTSEVTRNGLPKGSAYAAAKAAIVNLVKSVNREVSKHNVLVNCISPGPVDTKLEEDYRGEYLEFRKEYFKKFKETSNTGELVFMQEIALVVDMLMQAELRNLCGEEIFITGGVS